jgi:hypothetical protein
MDRYAIMLKKILPPGSPQKMLFEHGSYCGELYAHELIVNETLYMKSSVPGWPDTVTHSVGSILTAPDEEGYFLAEPCSGVTIRINKDDINIGSVE